MAGSWRLAPSDCGISTKGVRSDGMLPRIEGMAWIERAECSADMLSRMKITMLRPARFKAALSGAACTGVKRRASSSGAKYFA